MSDLLTNPTRLPMIAPSVLSCDFAHAADDCAAILAGSASGNAGPDGADLLHIDVMDGHFVPNLTMGPDMCKGLRRALPDVYLDVHLMVTDPQRFVDAFANAGANSYVFHIEPAIGIYKSKGKVEGPARYDAVELAHRIRDAGMSPGIAINPPTHPDTLIDVLPIVDMVLVMSIHPGFSGQSFIPTALDTTRAVSAQLRDDQRLEMDGGVGPDTASDVRRAGCDVLVAGNAIFSKPPDQRIDVIRAMRDG
ncbi:MAG: ribulose-phosphate 3-epimerase [Phycisphaerales bacterium JB043]